MVRAHSAGDRGTGEPVIRQARPEDASAVANCAHEAYAIYLPRMDRAPAPMIADFDTLIEQGKLCVLEDATGLQGFVVSYARGDHLHIENIAVLPSAQGLGYGRALIDHAEARASAAGLARVELYTNAAMVENLGYYRALGYREVGRRAEDGFDRIFFRKDLTNA